MSSVRKAHRPRKLALLAAVVLISAAAVGGYITLGDNPELLPRHFSAEEIAEWIRSWGGWAILGSILLMVAHSFVPLPSELIAIANGMVFGFAFGSLLTWVGAMLGAVCAFALARWLGREFVEAVLPRRYAAAIDEWTRDQATPVLLLSRFLPIVSFNLINYAAGLTSVSWWTFLWTTGLGIAPLTLAMVYLGEEIIAGPVDVLSPHWHQYSRRRLIGIRCIQLFSRS